MQSHVIFRGVKMCYSLVITPFNFYRTGPKKSKINKIPIRASLIAHKPLNIMKLPLIYPLKITNDWIGS